MVFDEVFPKLFNSISAFDIDESFPEKVDEDFCYTELEKHLVLEEVKKKHFTLFEWFADFLAAIGLEDYETTSELTRKIKVEELIKTSSTVNPSEDTELPGLVKKLQEKVVTQFFGSERMKKKVQEKDTRRYVNSVKVLTELGWKLELLGHNLVLLKKTLAEVCSNYYRSIQDHGGEMGLITRGGAFSGKQTVIFESKPQTKHSEMDLSEYNKLGEAILRGAQFLYYATSKVALAKGDHIQTFRSFRKTMRTRKRFGLSPALRDHFIKMDKEMTELSLEQIGGEHDNLELRKYEIRLRSEQQMRNLKLKGIIFYFNRANFVIIEA